MNIYTVSWLQYLSATMRSIAHFHWMIGVLRNTKLDYLRYLPLLPIVEKGGHERSQIVAVFWQDWKIGVSTLQVGESGSGQSTGSRYWSFERTTAPKVKRLPHFLFGAKMLVIQHAFMPMPYRVPLRIFYARTAGISRIQIIISACVYSISFMF